MDPPHSTLLVHLAWLLYGVWQQKPLGCLLLGCILAASDPSSEECVPRQVPAHLWLTVPSAQVKQALFVLEELVTPWKGRAGGALGLPPS